MRFLLLSKVFPGQPPENLQFATEKAQATFWIIPPAAQNNSNSTSEPFGQYIKTFTRANPNFSAKSSERFGRIVYYIQKEFSIKGMHGRALRDVPAGKGRRKIKPGWFRFSKAAWLCFEPRERLFPLPDYAFSESKVGKRLK